VGAIFVVFCACSLWRRYRAPPRGDAAVAAGYMPARPAELDAVAAAARGARSSRRGSDSKLMRSFLVEMQRGLANEGDEDEDGQRDVARGTGGGPGGEGDALLRAPGRAQRRWGARRRPGAGGGGVGAAPRLPLPSSGSDADADDDSGSGYDDDDDDDAKAGVGGAAAPSAAGVGGSLAASRADLSRERLRRRAAVTAAVAAAGGGSTPGRGGGGSSSGFDDGSSGGEEAEVEVGGRADAPAAPEEDEETYHRVGAEFDARGRALYGAAWDEGGPDGRLPLRNVFSMREGEVVALRRAARQHLAEADEGRRMGVGLSSDDASSDGASDTSLDAGAIPTAQVIREAGAAARGRSRVPGLGLGARVGAAARGAGQRAGAAGKRAAAGSAGPRRLPRERSARLGSLGRAPVAAGRRVAPPSAIAAAFRS